MKRVLITAAVLFLFVPIVHAEPKAPAGKVISDTWDAAYLEGAKTGYFHTRVEELDRDGKKIFRTTLKMDLTIKRYNAVVPMRMIVGSEETPEGKVLSLSMTQVLDKGKMEQTAKVEGDKLVIKSGQGPAKVVPWTDDVVGPYYAERLFKLKNVKPGDQLEYRNYELSLLRPLTVRVAIKDEEEVETIVPGKDGKPQKKRQVLLRAETKPDKVEIGGVNTPLPRMIYWLNKDREIVRGEMEQPGLGKVLLYRTTKAIAQAEGGAPAQLPDLGLTTLIPLNRRLKEPFNTRSVTYRITIKGDDEPGTTFVKDERQSVQNVKGDTFELLVKAIRRPVKKEDPEDAEEEFLKSSYFLDSNDARIKELAKQIVGKEKDPLKKARLVEKWVHDNMKPSSSIGFATASQVAQDLRGDCRQHAMLTTALCRAAGVPSRTAIGLVYVEDNDRGPVLGFHMWTEIWIQGQWLGLDATLGKGSVGPTHLKIASPNWNDTETLAPLLQVSRVMGKMKAEIVKVTVPKKK